MGVKHWLAAAVLALGVSAAVSAQEMRIQFAEKVRLPAVAGHAEFDAYGRRFSVDLESNDRLQSRLAVASKLGAGHSRLFRGKLENVPGSWVRLSKVGNGVEGAIWDGHDLYVVTSLANISANLVQQPDAAAGDTVIYRLSDTLGGLPPQFCGLDQDLPASAAKAPTALDQYKSLVSDLRINKAAAAPTEQLDLSVITDAMFDQYYGQLAHDAILQRINIVDGIFSEQVGVLIMPSELRATGASPDPFNSNDPATLLQKLADYRQATPTVRAAGLAHLITGRDLDGNVVGIAFRDSLCEPGQGVSLSDSSAGSFYGALVMAHELGHNFGAEHDGQAGSACESTPQNFLMAPTLNSSALFSQCSLSSMQAPIARARGRCIGALHFADLGLDVPASPYVVDVSSPFSFPVTVRSHGNLATQNAVLQVFLPSEITFQSATGASCSAANGTVTCALGSLAAGENRMVDVRLLGSEQRTFTVTAAVEADNDFLTRDNVKNVTVGVQSSVDAATSITLTPSTVFSNDTAEIAVDVQSLRTSAVRNARLIIQTGYMPILSIDAGANSCAIRPADYWNIECTLADIAPGASTRVLIRVRAPGTGTRDVAAVVIAPNDGEFINNRADRTLTVRPEREVIVTPSVESVRAAVGGTSEVTFTVRTAGRFPVENAVFTAVAPTAVGELLSVTPSAGTCPPPAPQQEWTCNFGTLSPGDERTVTVSFRANSVGTSAVAGRVRYTDGQFEYYASGFAWVYSALLVDVSVGIGRPLGVLSEGEIGSSGINIRSEGFDPAQNVVVTFEIPAPARLSNLSTSIVNPSGLQCVLVTPQRGRCTGSFTSLQTGYTYVSFDYMSDAPVDGVMHVEMTADNDAEPSNNVAEAPFRVVPFVDLALTSTAQYFMVLLGQEKTIDVVVTTGRNPSTGVRLDATAHQPPLELVSMRVNGADCPLTNPYGVPDFRMSCVLGNLPPNANVPVAVTYRTMQPDVSGQLDLNLVGIDSTYNNNRMNVRFQSMGPADIQLSIAGTAASGDNGSSFSLPRITVSSTTNTAYSVAVQIPLPAFTTLRSVSNSGFCSGTTTLECMLPPIPAGSSASIDVSLNATGTGTFTSNLVLTSANDSSNANNAATISISATAPPAPPPPPPPSSGGGSSSGGGAASGGKGGGGSFEWLGLLLLSVLLGRRVVARRAAG